MFRSRKMVWLIMLPGLLGLTVFYVLPFFGGIWYSLTDGSFTSRFVGIDNYRRIWQNELFLLGLKNTMELSLLCTPTIWLMSFLIALMLHRMKGNANFLRNVYLLPYLMPTSAILLIWLLAFDYGGVINRLLRIFGIPRVLWLQGNTLRAPVVLMYVWKNLGFSLVIFSAALQAVPTALYEYAELEGASLRQQAFSITLPMIIPTAFLILVMAWINAFKIFKEVYFIGGAYPSNAVYTLQHYMNNMFLKLDYQNVTSSAYSFAMIVLALFGTLFLIEKRVRNSMI